MKLPTTEDRYALDAALLVLHAFRDNNTELGVHCRRGESALIEYLADLAKYDENARITEMLERGSVHDMKLPDGPLDYVNPWEPGGSNDK